MPLIASVSRDLKILIVDDVPAVLRVLRKHLGKLGFNDLTEARSGQEAIEKISTETIQMILCDLHLKDMEGSEVLHFVRHADNSALQKIPFIIITSDFDQEDVEHMKTLGVSGYLLKPFSMEDLAEQLSEALWNRGRSQAGES